MSRLEEIKGRNDLRKIMTQERKYEFSMLKEMEYQRLVEKSVEDVDYLINEVELLQKAVAKSMSLLDQYEDILHLDSIIEKTPKELNADKE
ncbi:hypothetical protein A8709_33110 [Paenibacillus pectinilyticus]|uniref:Uncharacterized protein n=1 Tax=Paenibacillus pectinilyticus TaxID=512399 RepID=A0A1C0ZX16_9BACL|nr:hypothetical protein [Paenibacillus pectinilyticus]OCT12652.1 hypothetical protein A8709_33110 [Paenibacillus pectinilyticus]